MQYHVDLDRTIQHSVGIEKLKKKTVLITGCTGTIGAFLTSTLLRYNETAHAGNLIYAAGRNEEKIEKLFGKREDLVPVHYEMREPLTFDKKSDIIIHAAGNAHPAAFNGDPVGTMIGNVESTYRLLEYGKEHGTERMVYVSSGEVYSDMDAMNVRGCYPISKKAAENLCASYMQQFGLQTIVTRHCHTFGPHISESDNRAHVQFLRKGLEKAPIVLKSAGTQKRSYLYVADAISGILTVLNSGNAGESYDIASAENQTTIAGMAEMIAKACGVSVIREDPDSDEKKDFSPIPEQILDGRKLAELGWHAGYSLEEGINQVVKTLNYHD